MTTKTCTKCGETKPTDQFHKCRSSRDGLQSSCTTCTDAMSRAYYEANREHIVAQKRAYNEVNRDKINARQRARNTLMGNPFRDRAQEVTTRYATRIRDPWAPEEDNYVLTGPGTLMDKALQLSRTYDAVKNRAKLLRQDSTK